MIHRFLRSSSAWTYDRSIQLPFVAFDICTLDGRLFVLALRAESPEVIHEIRADGTIVKSFGVFYRSESLLSQEAFVGFGHLACSPEKSLIVAIAPLLPEILAYSVDGQIQWLSRIRSWSAPPIVETAGRRVGPDVEGIDSTDAVTDATVLPNGTLLVQVESRSIQDLRERLDRPTVRTYVLDITDGRGGLARLAWPRTMAADGTRLLTYVQDSFPQMTLWRYAWP